MRVASPTIRWQRVMQHFALSCMALWHPNPSGAGSGESSNSWLLHELWLDEAVALQVCAKCPKAGSEKRHDKMHDLRLERFLAKPPRGSARALALRRKASAVLAVEIDVARPDDVERLARETYAAFGAAHVLCNNAGVAVIGAAHEHSPADGQWSSTSTSGA